jgi:hypothetical protein
MKNLIRFVCLLIMFGSFGSVIANAQANDPMPRASNPHLNPVSESTVAMSLRAAKANGRIFGTAVLNTSGIEVKNTIAIPSETNAPFTKLMQGNDCAFFVSASENPETLDSGHRYGLYQKTLDSNAHTLTLAFRNVFHLPTEIRIVCSGTDEELNSLTVGEIQSEFSQSLSIYLNL